MDYVCEMERQQTLTEVSHTFDIVSSYIRYFRTFLKFSTRHPAYSVSVTSNPTR